MFNAKHDVIELAKKNENAKRVVESWSAAEWFTSKPELPEMIKAIVFRVDGEINTDDLPEYHEERPNLINLMAKA